MAKKKESKSDSNCPMPVNGPGEDKWQVRDDVDTLLKHEELRENKSRFNRAASRIKSTAARVSGRR